MTRDDVGFLRAQERDLEQLIRDCDPDDVSRIGFESRLKQVKRELAAAQMDAANLAEVTLLFRGAPVIGSRGIEATFASKTVEGFQKVVSKMAAARAGRRIGTRGSIPGASESRLFVSAVANGSFGFVLREMPTAGRPMFKTALAEAVDSTTRLLAQAAAGDEEFADAATVTDPAVLDELDTFLTIVNERGATLRVLTQEATAILDDSDTMSAARERTQHRRVEEQHAPQRGILWLLPDSGLFELRAPDGAVLKGHVSWEADWDRAQALVGRPVLARVTTITIARRGRETRRFVLDSVEPDPAPPEASS